MPTLQPAELWQESGRYDDYGKEMLRITDRHDRPMLYGPTAEEVVTDIIRHSIKSYRSLPINLFQIHWKFRDEVRPRFGVMRGREFLMKDGYGFDLDEAAAARVTYQKMFVSYLRILRNLGLNPIPLRADTGPIGGDCRTNSLFWLRPARVKSIATRTIPSRAIPQAVDYDDREAIAALVKEWTTDYAAADDLHDPAACPIPPGELLTARGIEVGHIFYFGTKYSAPMKAAVSNEAGALVNLHMGSYGSGSRGWSAGLSRPVTTSRASSGPSRSRRSKLLWSI